MYVGVDVVHGTFILGRTIKYEVLSIRTLILLTTLSHVVTMWMVRIWSPSKDLPASH